ncbi:serine-rich adhesin for platelets [Ochlerotatus camptorhynchus]|uniref:serine-rich adhesin for platelets n=1 Tax=Ochlerotatus camptorhynchus TaxID=644619 RepID=UPI0031D114B6
MDRSVDSIGSCSLDVDADSTDFSDTSGELNFLTPNSAKDIQREFTAGIKERCKLPLINCQAVTTVLDPVTGNISTVLTTTSPQAETATTAVASKKPSYLNLACCVNGYSNLTTYDSKLRQDINKSREVSPNRPIIATLHYNRSEGGNFQLTAPTLSYISMNNSINNNISNGGSKFGAMLNGAGRFANGGGAATAGQDVTDNAMFNGNGFGGGGLRTKVISSQSQISSVKETEKVVKKSFIQQRVEKLYGNAEGVVINKQIYNSNERKYLNNIANENVSKNYTNALHFNGNGNVATNGGTQLSTAGAGGGGVGFCGGGTKENLDENNKEIADDPDMEALPVMRHLRPEFRAQLQIFSPKKIPKTSPSRSVVTTAGSGAVSLNGNVKNNNHIISNGDLSHHHHHHSHLANGKVTSNGTTTSLSSASSALSSSSSSLVESKREQRSTTVTTINTTTTTASCESRSGSLVNSLSVVTSVEPVTSGDNNSSDASVPYNNNSSTQESRSDAAAVVIEQASVEQQPIIGAEQQKMKLSEPTTVVNGGDGGDCPTSTTVFRNGTSRKNGHHHMVEDDKENANGDLLLEVTPMAKTQLKDGNYFLQVLKNEQNRLLTMAADIDRDVEQLKIDGVEISEEVAGYVLAAAGKARLLSTKKMKQFEGLCYNNLNQSPDEKFQTTNEDLRGFWDMVMLQVNDIDASFEEIDSFRRNGWNKPEPKSPTPQVRSTARSTKLTKRPYKTPANGTSNGTTADSTAADAKKASAAAAAARREAQRKQLMELKRKQKLANSQQNVEIFVPETNGKTAVTFADTNGAPPVDAS